MPIEAEKGQKKKYVISIRYSEALFPDMALGVVISVNIQVVFDIVRQKYI